MDGRSKSPVPGSELSTDNAVLIIVGFLCGVGVKNLPANAGDIRDTGSIPGSGRYPGEGNGKPLQYSCLENPHGQRSLAGYSPWGHKVGHN